MTRVYFIRHAEPNFNNHDDLTRELSSKGLEDRKLVTKFLKDKQIDLIVSSPYKRAIDTIKEFADLEGMEIEKIEDFRERRVDSGWIRDFQQFTQSQWKDFEYKLSDGECLREVQERNIAALKQLIEEHQGKHIVVGSHGTALSTIMNYFNPSFEYEDFVRIKGFMPWIVCFTFEGQNCVEIKEYNLLEEK